MQHVVAEHTTCNMQHATSSMHHAAHIMQPAGSQHAICNMQHAAEQHATYCIHHATRSRAACKHATSSSTTCSMHPASSGGDRIILRGPHRIVFAVLPLQLSSAHAPALATRTISFHRRCVALCVSVACARAVCVRVRAIVRACCVHALCTLCMRSCVYSCAHVLASMRTWGVEGLRVCLHACMRVPA